ncbi:uncharacterized protein LOC144497834 [Mustelus asterias]
MLLKRNWASTLLGIYLFAFNPFVLIAALTVRVNQDSLNGTVNQSVLLPASYTVSDTDGYLRIKWLRKTGTRIVDYRCISKRGNMHTGRCHYLSVPEDYKHRTVLFPENASLLLKDLQLNDSGIYELSISHSMGTRSVTLMLTVQPQAGHGMDTDKKRTPGVEAKVRYLSLVVILFFVCFTVKTQKGCKRMQKQTGKENATQDGRQKSSTNDPAVLYSDMKSPESTGTTERNVYVTDEETEYGRIQIWRN